MEGRLYNLKTRTYFTIELVDTYGIGLMDFIKLI